MRNTIGKILVAATFGLILSGSVMAGEDIDAFTLNFTNDASTESVTGVKVNKASYTPSTLTTDSILDICYDTAS